MRQSETDLLADQTNRSRRLVTGSASNVKRITETPPLCPSLLPRVSCDRLRAPHDSALQKMEITLTLKTHARHCYVSFHFVRACVICFRQVFGRLKIKEVEINLASAKSDTNLAVNRVHINTGEAGKHDFSLQELYKNTACFHNSLFILFPATSEKSPSNSALLKCLFFIFLFFFSFPSSVFFPWTSLGSRSPAECFAFLVIWPK